MPLPSITIDSSQGFTGCPLGIKDFIIDILRIAYSKKIDIPVINTKVSMIGYNVSMGGVHYLHCKTSNKWVAVEEALRSYVSDQSF